MTTEVKECKGDITKGCLELAELGGLKMTYTYTYTNPKNLSWQCCKSSLHLNILNKI